MAELIHSSKLPRDWTDNELLAYHITVKAQTPQQFFCIPDLPLESIDPSLINSTINADNVSDSTFQYLTHIGLATNGGQTNMIHDFSRETPCIVGFSEWGLALISRFIIPLTICGDNLCDVETNLCLLDWQSIILLILRDDKPAFNDLEQPEPQVIAEAIAAYQHNNRKRQTRGLPILDAMTIPCITMVGRRPTFYLVPVTKALSTAVVTGQYPKATTKVMKCITFSPSRHWGREGMEAPAFRHIAFQCFVAFRGLAKYYWQTFIVSHNMFAISIQNLTRLLRATSASLLHQENSAVYHEEI